MTTKRLLKRVGAWGMMSAAAGFAAAFLALAMFLWLEPHVGGAGAALSVAIVLALIAALLFFQGSRRSSSSGGAASAAPAGANPQGPAPVSLAGAGEALALARWVVRERPLIALAVCAGAGYVLVRHPRAIGDLMATATKLLSQQAGQPASGSG